MPRVIVAADDDEDDIDLLKLLFRKAGITQPLEVFRHGEELIESLQHRLKKAAAALPMLCLLDVKMPGISGHDVLRWIRGQSRLDAMPVVMVSSSELPDDVKLAAEQGAQCYLAKYPQPSVLRRLVDEAQNFAQGPTAGTWFGLPANLLLRWGLAG